jgi:hypothetical protein
MPVTTSPVEILRESGEKAAETLALWSAAHQSVIRQLVDFTAATANEGFKLYSELQSSAIAAVREGQEIALSKQVDFQELSKDPLGWYQKRVLEGVESAQLAFKRVETVAQTVTVSAERMQRSAELAGKQIQATFTSLGTQLKDIYTSAA